MIVLECNQPTYFDVDDTLVGWGYAATPNEKTIPITCRGITQHVVPHRKHIEQLKAHAARGHTIIVWTKGGWEWGKAVVEALSLTEFVHLVVEKPEWYYDDKHPNEFLGMPQFFKDYE